MTLMIFISRSLLLVKEMGYASKKAGGRGQGGVPLSTSFTYLQPGTI